MPVIGMKFDSVNASRSDKRVDGEIKINSTPKIVAVKEIEIPSIKKKALAVNFDFVTSYEPAMGEIKISGEVLYTHDKNSKAMEVWKKKKKLPSEIEVEILNHLFRHCLLKTANLAEDLQLPPPLRFPIVKSKKEQTDYIG